MKKILPDIELVIFDCDGTLVESEYINNKATSEILMGLGHKKFTVGYCLQYFSGYSAHDILRTLSELKIQDPQKMLDLAHARAVEIAKTHLKAVPKALEVVTKINVPMCIASNGQRFVVLESLKIAGLHRYFGEKHVFTAESVKNAKPAPDLYLHSARVMGDIDPKRCLVIEDSVVGVTAGKAANMNVLGFIGGKHHGPKAKEKLMAAGAFATIEDLSELLGFLRR